MKQGLLLLILATGFFCSCTNSSEEKEQKNEQSSDSTATADTLVSIEEPKDDSTMTLDEFYALFPYNATSTYDLGWRFGQGYIEDGSITITKYLETNEIEGYTLKLPDGKLVKPEFFGFAHSYKKLKNGHILIITFKREEIGQAIQVMEVDEEFRTVQHANLTSNGGDEGSWYHKFGGFNSDFTRYTSTYVTGFMKDTSDFRHDTLTFP
jgi:hypothetical protein